MRDRGHIDPHPLHQGRGQETLVGELAPGSAFKIRIGNGPEQYLRLECRAAFELCAKDSRSRHIAAHAIADNGHIVAIDTNLRAMLSDPRAAA